MLDITVGQITLLAKAVVYCIRLTIRMRWGRQNLNFYRPNSRVQTYVHKLGDFSTKVAYIELMMLWEHLFVNRNLTKPKLRRLDSASQQNHRSGNSLPAALVGTT